METDICELFQHGSDGSEGSGHVDRERSERGEYLLDLAVRLTDESVID